MQSSPASSSHQLPAPGGPWPLRPPSASPQQPLGSVSTKCQPLVDPGLCVHQAPAPGSPLASASTEHQPPVAPWPLRPRHLPHSRAPALSWGLHPAFCSLSHSLSFTLRDSPFCWSNQNSCSQGARVSPLSVAVHQSIFPNQDHSFPERCSIAQC